MADTQADILAALGLSTAQLTALTQLLTSLVNLDSDPTLPNSEDTIPAMVKVGGAVSIIDAASVQAGGTGYSQDGLASGIAISGLAAQITVYQQQATSTRQAASTANEAAETASQTDQALVASLSANPDIDADGLVQLAQAQARIAKMRSDNADRTTTAEASAQALEAVVPSLQARLIRLCTGDLTAA